MADISAEITAFKNAAYGEDVRDSMVSLANKLNNVATSTSSKVDAWDLSLISGIGIMPRSGTVTKADNGYLLKNVSFAIFDRKYGYRFTVNQTINFTTSSVLLFSESDDSFEEVDFSTKGTGEYIYLWQVNADRLSSVHNYFALCWNNRLWSYQSILENMYAHQSLESSVDVLTEYISSVDSYVIKKHCEFLNTHTEIPMLFSEMTHIAYGYYSDLNGTISYTPDHRIVCFDASGINYLRYEGNTTVSSAFAGLIMKDSEGTIKRVIPYNSLRANNSSDYQKTFYVSLPKKGLPDGTTIYMVDWYGGKPTVEQYAKYPHEIYAKWYTEEPYIQHGKNLCDPEQMLPGGNYYYSTGAFNANSTYRSWSIDTSGVEHVAITRLAHLIEIDEYGSYIAGMIMNDSNQVYTASDGVSNIIVSLAGDQPPMQIEYNSERTAYEAFYTTFKEVRENEYTSGTEYFTLSLNTASLKNGENSTQTVDSETMVNVYGVISLPLGYSINGEPIPAIMITHGSGFYVSENDWFDRSAPWMALRNKFLHAGYAIFDINGYTDSVPHSTWGCPRVVRAYRKLYEYVTSHYNVQKQVNLYGFSMGGIVGLNFMLHNRDIIKCACLSAPVTDLYEQVWHYDRGRRLTAADAYDFDGRNSVSFVDPITQEQEDLYTNNVERRLGYNPHEFIIDGKMDQNLPPIRIWHGTSDTAVSYEPSVTFINARRAANHDDTIRLVTNAGHEICYGGNAICNTEYVQFFDRYNT